MKSRAIRLAVEMPDAVRLALDLAAEETIAKLVQDRAHLLDVSNGFPAVVGEDALEALRRRRCIVRFEIGWIVAQQIVLGENGARVDPEPVDAALQPEAKRVSHGTPDLRVAPVEVGLLGQEGVVVILAGSFVPL